MGVAAPSSIAAVDTSPAAPVEATSARVIPAPSPIAILPSTSLIVIALPDWEANANSLTSSPSIAVLIAPRTSLIAATILVLSVVWSEPIVPISFATVLSALTTSALNVIPAPEKDILYPSGDSV